MDHRCETVYQATAVQCFHHCISHLAHTHMSYPVSSGKTHRTPVLPLKPPLIQGTDPAPPPPVYDPTNPPGHVSLTPNSIAALPTTSQLPLPPVTFPVTEPATITPYIPSRAGSIRPPSYRSGNNTPRPASPVAPVAPTSRPAPPGYETVV